MLEASNILKTRKLSIVDSFKNFKQVENSVNELLNSTIIKTKFKNVFDKN